jgi:hypothetical protein
MHRFTNPQISLAGILVTTALLELVKPRLETIA